MGHPLALAHPRAARAAALTLAALLSGPALAQDPAQPVGPPRNGYDGDIDLIKPIFAPDINPGVDVPTSQLPGTVRTGIALGYTRNPLVLYEFDTEVGSVVANRFQAYAGVSVDITRAFTARLVIPAYFQWGSTVPRYAAEGFAVGDITIGGHVALVRRPAGGLGIRLDVSTPTSRGNFYAGERLPRFNPALIGMADAGMFRFMVDVGANLRIRDVETKEEFTLSQEIMGSLGFRVMPLPDRLAVGATVYGRFGFGNTFGAAELAGEALATVGYKPVKFLWVDVSAGRGFTRGYGSSDFRTLVQLRFVRVRKLRPGEEGYEINSDGTQDLDRPLLFNVKTPGEGFEGRDIQAPEVPGFTDVDGLVMDFEEPKEPEWDEGEVVRVKDNRIELRFALNFKLGTAQLLPESLKYLDAVADVLQNDARILHLMIEGHASPDGPYERNYTLSLDRAQAIWRYLVEKGVHPTRMSTRAMGEVVPIDATGGLDEYESSRRVVFEIVKQLPSGQTAPEYDLEVLAPWNGSKLDLVQPRMPTAEEIEAAEQRLDRLAEQKRRGQAAPRPAQQTDSALDDTSFDDGGDDLSFEDDPPDAPATPDTPADAPSAPSDPPAPVEEESP